MRFNGIRQLHGFRTVATVLHLLLSGYLGFCFTQSPQNAINKKPLRPRALFFCFVFSHQIETRQRVTTLTLLCEPPDFVSFVVCYGPTLFDFQRVPPYTGQLLSDIFTALLKITPFCNKTGNFTLQAAPVQKVTPIPLRRAQSLSGKERRWCSRTRQHSFALISLLGVCKLRPQMLVWLVFCLSDGVIHA